MFVTDMTDPQRRQAGKRWAHLLLAAASAWGAGAALASAQAAQPAAAAFPVKPITWLVGQPAGGSVDLLTRLAARHAEQTLGQPVVVENRPGAAGAIALQAAAKAQADGYTLISLGGPILTNTPVPRIGKELTGVATLARGAMVLVGSSQVSSLPPSLKELLAQAQQQPGHLSFATSGNGTSQHLAGELLNQMAQTRMVHVPYKGGSQAVIDVVGGQVPLGMLGITPVLAHIKSGKLRAYGVSTAQRSPSLPEVPTLAEAGVKGFDADQWFVVAAPAGLAPERAAKLNAAINQALQQAEVKAGYEANGVSPTLASPEQTSAMVAREMQRWQALAQKARLPLE